MLQAQGFEADYISGWLGTAKSEAYLLQAILLPAVHSRIKAYQRLKSE